jgi:tetratricopeptide (TPR) repeat protein
MDSYRAALAIKERLASADPGNSSWQRELSVSQDTSGDILVAQGKWGEALESYRASQAIADRLAKADPSNAGWQRDLSVSHNNIGDVLRTQGKFAEALENYRAAFTIVERIRSAPGEQSSTAAPNVNWRILASASHACAATTGSAPAASSAATNSDA